MGRPRAGLDRYPESSSTMQCAHAPSTMHHARTCNVRHGVRCVLASTSTLPLRRGQPPSSHAVLTPEMHFDMAGLHELAECLPSKPKVTTAAKKKKALAKKEVLETR